VWKGAELRLRGGRLSHMGYGLSNIPTFLRTSAARATPWMTGLGAATIFLQAQTRLAFYPIGPEQPARIEGVPEWRDSILVRHDTIIVRHLRERRAYTGLRATLRRHGRRLDLHVVEGAGGRNHEKGGVVEAAYEAQIGPLRPGSYTLLLRDDGYRSVVKPIKLRRAVEVAAP
jgi:hypothetical protein